MWGKSQCPSAINPPRYARGSHTSSKQASTPCRNCGMKRNHVAVTTGFRCYRTVGHALWARVSHRPLLKSNRSRNCCLQVQARSKKKKERRAAMTMVESDPEGKKSTFLSKPLSDESDLPPGSEVVSMDTEILVHQEQKGFFPAIAHLTPRDEYLSVVVTREYDVVDEWIAQKEAENKLRSVGYMIHTKHDKKRPTYVALIQDNYDDPAQGNGAGEALELSNEDEDEVDDDRFDDEDEELTDFEMDLYGEVLDETEYPDEWDDDKPAGVSEADNSGEEQEEYARLRNGGAQGLFDYYQDDYNEEIVAQDNREIREALMRYPGQELPPIYTNMAEQPRAWTRSPEEASFWENDQDGPSTEERVPEMSISLDPHRISILTLAVRSSILIVQIRRMRCIPPRLYDLLYDEKVAKFAFDHENKAKLLRSMGIIVNGGSVLTDLLLKAYNTPGLAPVPLCLQTAPPQGLAKLLMGVDITDREFYFNDYNNPLLSERHVNCLAKEAYAAWGVQHVLSRAERPNFFGVVAYVMNPLPASYVEESEDLPATRKLNFTWKRGPFYKDMGKLLPKLQYDVEVTVTRNPAEADKWCKERRLEKVESLGYNMEWCPGREGRISAIFSLATGTKVLICQQLYMDHIPESLVDMLQLRIYQKLGPTPFLYVFKGTPKKVVVKGCRSIFFYLLVMFGKIKKGTLPKVVRDMNFNIACDMFVAVSNGTTQMDKQMRWDRPDFTDEQIEYQGLRAWHGWALDSILRQGNPEHAERLKAYLMGPSYIPSDPKLPARVQRHIKEQLDMELQRTNPSRGQPKSPATKGLMYQQTVDETNMYEPDVYVPEKLEKMAAELGQVSSDDLNDLLDSFF